MADNTLKVRLQSAYKSSADWNTLNPVLKNGEVGFVSSPASMYGWYKIGNGTSTWNQLPYSTYRPLNNGDFDTINVTDETAGNLTVTGAARFLNTIQGTAASAVNATSATSAAKLTTNAGGVGTPVYFSNGVPTNCTLSSIYVGRATADESGNNIKATYASSISMDDHTLTLKNKNGTSLAAVDLHFDDLKSLIHKRYESTSYYATAANSWEAASWYFMSVKPDSWYKPWRVKFKVHSYCPSYANVDSYTWATYTGRADAIAYCNWNERYDAAHYYLPYYPLKKAGFDAGYGHAIGISILYGGAYTTSSYYRTFEIDYYECENCTVTILDTPVKWANWTGTGTTNYGSLGGPNAVDRGLQETGDANTTTENRIGYFPGKTGAKGIWATSLFMEDANGTYQDICTASDGTVTSSNRTTATTKIANTNGFKVGGTIWYTNTTYAANTNISGNGVVYSSISIFDSRYAFNTTLTANSLTPYKEVYLVGTIHDDNLFYLDTVWWTQTPTDTSKIYILVGACFDSTTSNCRVTLYEQNMWYYYDGTMLREYVHKAKNADVAATLDATEFIEDNEPYLFRTAPREAGDRVYEDAIVGGSVAWNQLVQIPSSSITATKNGCTVTDNRDGSYTISGTPSEISTWKIKESFPRPREQYKYLVLGMTNTIGINIADTWGSNLSSRANTIFTPSSSNRFDLSIVARTSFDGTATTIKPQIINLTLALGSTIADYAYILEQSEAGSGIAWLKSQGFFTKDYYPYNAGGIESVKTSAKKVFGFNQWDEQWETGTIHSDGTPVPSQANNQIRSKNYCPIFPNTVYYATCQKTDGGNDNKYYLYINYYDENKNFISKVYCNRVTFTTPSNARYFKLNTNSGGVIYGNTYNHDICINFHWDGERDGEYEAYEEHTYPLDSDLELRGIPKLVDGKIKYDGDTYESDGTVTRKYGIVDLGTLNWARYTASTYPYFYVDIGMKGQATNNIVNAICAKYVSGQVVPGYNYFGLESTEKTISSKANTSLLFIQDNTYNDVAAFKTAMSGVYLVYELATPTTETADPYINPQIVDNWGTEEFVDERDVPVPVGHESRYPKNDNYKLSNTPAPPGSVGDYIVHTDEYGESIYERIDDVKVNYAGTADYATNSGTASSASTAAKLSTNAGATNWPVYFTGGIPTTVDKNATGNALINALTTGDSNATTADYYVAQYAGGGAATNTYHRRPVIKLPFYTEIKVNGNYLNLNKQGSTSNLTVPYATSAGAAPIPGVDRGLSVVSSKIGHATTLTASADISGTAAVSGWGQVATVAVPSIDAYGHTTACKTKTITMPSSTGLATTAYVNERVANAVHFKGGFNPSNADALKTPAKEIGDMYVATAAGTFYNLALESGDSIIFQATVAANTNPISADFIGVEKTVSVTNNNPTLSFGSAATVGSVEGVDLTLTMPSTSGLSTTDEKLKMTPASATKFYPAGGIQTTANTSTAYFSSAVYIQGTSVVATNFVGTATTASYAANAAKVNNLTVQTAVPSGAVFTDTKNTAGSTNSDSKLFLIGATSQAANPQTYSDSEVYTTNGTLTTKITQATQSVNVNTANSGTAGGISLYGTEPTTYGVAMRGTGNGGKHGGVQGDWAIYTYMAGATNRGFIWKNSSTAVASIDCAGNEVLNGSLTVGGSSANNTGVTLQFNSTTKSLDFVFA